MAPAKDANMITRYGSLAADPSEQGARCIRQAKISCTMTSYQPEPGCRRNYAEEGVLDLRQNRRDANVASCDAPTCFLIEINPRPPGFQSLYATRITYGIDYMALHLLACLQDDARIHAFSHPTRASTGEAKFWCQIVFIANSDRQGGICTTQDPYETLIDRHPELKAHIVMGQYFFKQGDYAPPLTADARAFRFLPVKPR